MLPKVEFELLSLEAEAQEFYRFIFSSNKFSHFDERIYRQYPELKARLANVNDKNESFAVIKDFLAEYRQAHHDMIQESVARLTAIWNPVNDRAFKALADIMEKSWPAEHPVIKGHISLNPICPRNIDRFDFGIYFRSRPESVKGITIHESFHFLYFQKLRELYPHLDRHTFEMPNLEWHLSEIIVPIAMNNSVLQDIAGELSYPKEIHAANRIKGKPVHDYFTNLFVQCQSKKLSFLETLAVLRKEAYAHEKAIVSFKPHAKVPIRLNPWKRMRKQTIFRRPKK